MHITWVLVAKYVNQHHSPKQTLDTSPQIPPASLGALCPAPMPPPSLSSFFGGNISTLFPVFLLSLFLASTLPVSMRRHVRHNRLQPYPKFATLTGVSFMLIILKQQTNNPTLYDIICTFEFGESLEDGALAGIAVHGHL